jgi:CheY-like chemotaxis protein
MDDEKPVREIAVLMLEKLGHVAFEAKNGEELIAAFKAHQKNATPIDIILMDLTVPGGMGGKEAMQEILEIDPAARAIVSSGYSNDPVMADYKRYGFKAAVTKPFLFEDLQHAITDVMSG